MQMLPQGEAILYHQFSLADRSVRGLDGGGEISPPGQARQLEALLPANDLRAQGLGHLGVGWPLVWKWGRPATLPNACVIPKRTKVCNPRD